MDLCLTHPEHGYYSQASAIGGDNQGDFITAIFEVRCLAK